MMRRVANNFWAGTAITLGVWETAAVTTKKVPTITRTCQSARKSRYRRGADATIAVWLLGLALHLFKSGD